MCQLAAGQESVVRHFDRVLRPREVQALQRAEPAERGAGETAEVEVGEAQLLQRRGDGGQAERTDRSRLQCESGQWRSGARDLKGFEAGECEAVQRRENLKNIQIIIHWN